MTDPEQRVAPGGGLLGASTVDATAPAAPAVWDRWAPGGARGVGGMGVLWVALWTAFLWLPIKAGWEQRGTVNGWLGILGTLAFGFWYLAVIVGRRRGRFGGWANPQIGWGLAATGVAASLAAVVALGVGQVGTTCAVYVSVLAVLTMPSWPGLAVAGLNALAWWGAGYVVEGWEPDFSLLFGMVAAAVAVFGVRQTTDSNRRLRVAQEENARLAISEERNRFARDLHDILGHSLTVITVKAELAHRLLSLDPARAAAELADLERLSRDALADVRRAVEGYRELTLPGEIARARAALDAAEITADLPGRTDDVPGDLRELFAWTVREGVTNVIRHSGATRCTVRLTSSSVEIADNGRGDGHTDGLGGHGGRNREADAGSDATDTAALTPQPHGGHGLEGLRERAAAVGATLTTSVARPHGFILRVAL